MIKFEKENCEIKIFHDFSAFVLSPTPEYEYLESTEMLQKHYHTELWECSFKNSWDVLQITSNQKWFTHISNQAPGVCLLKASNPSRFIKLSMFLFILVLTPKKLK